MNCPKVQDWLFEADRGAAVPADVAAHLQECAACRDMAERIRRLEADWRALPAPAMSDGAKQRVLAAVTAEETGEAIVPLRGSATRAPRRWLSAKWALAAAALIAVGIGLYAWRSSSDAQTVPDPFDRLLDMNVALAEADPSERAKIYDDAQADLNDAADSMNLSPDDAEIAKTLLDNANSMAKNQDPVAEAERLSAVADKLLDRLQAAVKNKKPPKLAKAAKQYALADRAALGSWDNADDLIADDLAQGSRLDAVAEQNSKRQEAFETLLLSAPKGELDTLKKAMDHAGHPGKAHKNQHKKRAKQSRAAAASLAKPA